MLILLDIDGVMVSGASWKKLEFQEDGFYKFSDNATKGLKKIISETGASIILTTSHKSRFNLREWELIFQTRGINTNIDKLPDNIKNLGRKDEILQWLKLNIIEDFVIIDDDKSLNDLPLILKQKTIFTNFITGLNEKDAISAIEVLNRNTLA